jgi:hypothetical protein
VEAIRSPTTQPESVLFFSVFPDDLLDGVMQLFPLARYAQSRKEAIEGGTTYGA